MNGEFYTTPQYERRRHQGRVFGGHLKSVMGRATCEMIVREILAPWDCLQPRRSRTLLKF